MSAASGASQPLLASEEDGPSVPLDGDAILRLLRAVAAKLDAGTNGEMARAEVVVVGGSLLAVEGLRAATADVDSARSVGPDLAAAVEQVAEQNGLSPKWLNDRARPYLPSTFRLVDCSELHRSRGLVVYGAPLSQVFLMKMNAGRAQDLADLERMWERVGFRSPDDAAHAYREAYPNEADDPYLADWVREVVGLRP